MENNYLNGFDLVKPDQRSALQKWRDTCALVNIPKKAKRFRIADEARTRLMESSDTDSDTDLSNANRRGEQVAMTIEDEAGTRLMESSDTDLSNANRRGEQVAITIEDEAGTRLMESSDTDLSNANRRGEQVAITIEDAHQDTPQVPFHTANPTPEQIHKYGGILYLLYAGALVVMYPSLTQLAQLKFQNNKQSPFETHSFFANMAVVAYTIAIPTSVILFAMKTHLESSTREHFYPIYFNIYKTLKSVFCFSGILALLSLVSVLLIPHELNWIGYLLLLVIFIVIFACNFLDYKVIVLRKIKDASELNSELSKVTDSIAHGNQ